MTAQTDGIAPTDDAPPAADADAPAAADADEDRTPADAPPDRPRTARVTVPALDGFRGLAALTVVLYHVTFGSGSPPLGTGAIRNVFLSGYLGVDFFFVISGFVLFLPTVVADGRFGSVRAYALRRVARIVPGYYAVLVTAVLVLPLLSSVALAFPDTTRGAVASFVLHLTFLQHTVGALRPYVEGFGVLGVVWTLTVEAAFYVVLPMVAAWYFRHPFVGLAIAVVAGQLWKLAAVHAAFSVRGLPGTANTPLLRLTLLTQLPTYLGEFAAGMTVAWLFVRWRHLERPWLPWLTVAGQATSAVAIVWFMYAAGLRDMKGTNGPWDHWTGTLPVALMFALLVLSTALAPRWAQFPVANRAARRYGDVSYGVYLWHSVMAWIVLTTHHRFFFGGTGGWVRLFVVMAGGSYVVASASFAWIERPAIRWARGRSRLIEAAHARGATGPAASMPEQAR